jgi:hypothetical protein
LQEINNNRLDFLVPRGWVCKVWHADYGLLVRVLDLRAIVFVKERGKLERTREASSLESWICEFLCLTREKRYLRIPYYRLFLVARCSLLGQNKGHV